MKKTFIVASIMVAVSGNAYADIHARDVKVSYWGTLERALSHHQGEMTDFKNEVRPQLKDLYQQVDNNTAWNDRQEGVIRQNRGRLDEHDQQIAGNTNRSAGNQQAIGFLQETDAQLSGAISETNAQLAITDKRSINNAGRLDGAEGAIRETNSQLAITDDRTIQNASTISSTQERVEGVNNQSIARDEELGARIGSVDRSSRDRDSALGGRIDARVKHDSMQDKDRARVESESVERDQVLAGQVQTVDSNSRDRDNTLAGRIDYNAAVNHAYQQQTAEQFAQHAQALSNERDERREADQDLKAGVASAISLGSHHYDTNYRGLQMSIAGGFYDGENAQSLSLGGALSDNVFGSVAASTDSRGKQAYSVQSNWKF